MSRALRCRSCGRSNEAAGSGVTRQPAGQVSICVFCFALGVFTGRGLETRLPTVVESRAIRAAPGIQRCLVAVQRYRARNARWN